MPKLQETDYATLAGFRYELRKFSRYSERAAGEAGLTPRQHQALLAIRAGPGGALHVGQLAERLFLRPHSASELVQRMVEQDLVTREPGTEDKRQVTLTLSDHGEKVLEYLSQSHRAELRRLRPMLQELLAGLG
ncbi:MAG TPA: helix-turn-helix domain-containing protein [Croceibacterium sp.]|jgi:DNA-binding MarR family transcriptional regulator